MSDAQPLIERMKECWRDYQAMPDTKDRQFGRLNLVAFMGERMGKVLDYITELQAKLADSQPAAQPSTQLQEIVAQLRSCGYQCETGALVDNAAWRELERMAQQQADVVQPFAFDWDAIPPDYNWAVVERYGVWQWQVHAHVLEPHWNSEMQTWDSDGDFEHVYVVLDLPLGVDHRLLKQRRPTKQGGSQ